MGVGGRLEPWLSQALESMWIGKDLRGRWAEDSGERAGAVTGSLVLHRSLSHFGWDWWLASLHELQEEFILWDDPLRSASLEIFIFRSQLYLLDWWYVWSPLYDHPSEILGQETCAFWGFSFFSVPLSFISGSIKATQHLQCSTRDTVTFTASVKMWLPELTDVLHTWPDQCRV